MAGSDQGGYADAVDRFRRDAGAARLADPGEHFPYKRDAAIDALDHPGEDLRELARRDAREGRVGEVGERLVAAEAAHRADPDDADLEAAYEKARDELVAAFTEGTQHPHISPEIIEASAAYVEAQAALLADPDDTGARDIYERAKTALVDARRAHRAGRAGTAAAGNG